MLSWRFWSFSLLLHSCGVCCLGRDGSTIRTTGTPLPLWNDDRILVCLVKGMEEKLQEGKPIMPCLLIQNIDRV